MSGLKLWDKLQEAEGKIVARVRAAISVVATSGLAFADQVAAVLGQDLATAHTWATRIRIASVLSIGLSFLLRAGDKNEKTP